MEIYLSHMVVFRVLEKLRLNTIIGNGALQYTALAVCVILGAAAFAVVMQRIMTFTEQKLMKRKAEKHKIGDVDHESFNGK